MRFVKFLKELSKEDVNIAGGKAANLGEMIKIGLPVPDGYAVLATAYKYFIEKTGLKEKIREILEKTDVNDTKQLEENTAKIRELILNTPMPKEIEKEILEAYKKLCKKEGKEIFVVARSSATAEDVKEASFAGQQETILNVKGENSLLKAVKRCWASLFTPRATFYRTQKGFDHLKVYMCVVIQKQLGKIPKEDYLKGKYVAGVGFTIHPTTSDKTKIVIEAHYGQGEAVVSGAVTPDTFVIDKKTGKVVEQHVAEKKIMKIAREDEGLEEVEVPEELRNIPSINEKILKQLWKLALKLEKHYKFPQDFEWAAEYDKVYLVQSRPVTVFYEKKASQVEINLKPILQGLAASPGIAVGKVKIIKDASEIHKVQEGDILVTIMTNPDMVPAMKKAKAIITDEGGMTCLAPNTKLITNYGILEAEKLYELLKEREAWILTYDFIENRAKWRRIVAAGRRKDTIYRVFTEKGYFDITKNHKIITKIGSTYVKVPLNVAYEKGFEILSISRIPEKIISIKSEKLAYLIGSIISRKNLGAKVINVLNSASISASETISLISKILNNLEVFVLNLDVSSTKSFLKGLLSNENLEFDEIKNAIILAYLKLGLEPIVKDGKLIVSKELKSLKKGKYLINYMQKLKEDFVYNFEVDAKEEINKNYVILTSEYLPIVVSNSHAAIVSRELGIPCIVGTQKATKVLKDEQIVTVDAYSGKVYEGKVEELERLTKKEELDIEEVSRLKTKTKIYMNLGVPEAIRNYKHLPFEGIGLMRIEFIIGSYIKYHPLYLIEQGKEKEFIEKLAEGIALVAKEIYPRPVIVRFSDFKTNEYAKLIGGEKYEPKEHNPMLGWRGVSRYISKEYEKAFRLECRAIKKVREQGFKNVWVMLPFVRTVWEVEKVLEIMKEEGLERSEDFKVWLMAEVPSNIFLVDKFSKYCDGFSIGSNDLTQLVLGVDRDSEILAKMGYFDERNEAVLRAIETLIKEAHKYGKTVSICGQAPSIYPEITEFLVKAGIDSISVNPDAVVKTRKLVYEIEKKLRKKV